MEKTPLYVTLQPIIFELLDNEPEFEEEPEFLFTVRQIMHFTGNQASDKTYRKALKALVKTGKVFRKQSRYQEPTTWCSECVKEMLDELLAKEAKENLERV